MAFQVGVYRTSGGDEQVIASSGVQRVQSGGTQVFESGATLTLTGQAVTSTGAGTFNSVTSTGAITGETFTSTGATSGTAKFKSVTSTGAITGETFTSTGATSGTAKFRSMTSTGVVTGDSFTSTGGTDGSGKFNTVTSTGVVTGDSFTSTGGTDGSGKFNSVTSTGTGTFNAVSSTGQILGLFTQYVETATSSWSSITGYGLSIIKSTNASDFVFALPAPVAGREKWIMSITPAGSTPGVPIVTSSGASASVNSNTSILFSSGVVADPEWVHLIGQNTTNWLTIGYSTDVSFSTT